MFLIDQNCPIWVPMIYGATIRDPGPGIWVDVELGVGENYFSMTFFSEVGSEVMGERGNGRQVNISLALPLFCGS